MADRNIHYEAAFEAYLRDRATPYVAVDEAKRALFSDAKLKSFDFVVYARQGPNLLVDIKGRQFRGGNGGGTRAALQTWATEQDIADLMQWEQVFGSGFTAVLAFVYWVDPPLAPQPGMYEFRGKWYWMLGVPLAEYRANMRRRSPKWGTVAVPAAQFRRLARPIETWLI